MILVVVLVTLSLTLKYHGFRGKFRTHVNMLHQLKSWELSIFENIFNFSQVNTHNTGTRDRGTQTFEVKVR